jgi:hypothetical protein
MCLACAVPVRGRALGVECLASALGPDTRVPEPVVREPGSTARTVARAAFALAVVASILPWSRFGAGAGPFGAWVAAPRWSMIAAVASVAGLLVSFAQWWPRARSSGSDLASVVAGLLVAAGSLLAIAQPPDFTSPWLGPWVALAAGVAACLASVVALRSDLVHAPANV